MLLAHDCHPSYVGGINKRTVVQRFLLEMRKITKSSYGSSIEKPSITLMVGSTVSIYNSSSAFIVHRDEYRSSRKETWRPSQNFVLTKEEK
jgi:CRISPR/Cas system CMR-associated protein Cmr5 small subunit